MNPSSEPGLREFADAEALFDEAERLVRADARAACAARGVWHLALAGGGTPRQLYERLQDLSLERAELWFGDERCVPPDDARSNHAMVQESWLRHAAGAPAALHRIEVERGASEAALRYGQKLASAPALDLALLGLGEDAHTASLFPGRPESLDELAWAVAAQAPDPPRERVSMGLRPLLRARTRIFLVVGESKHPALRRVLARETALAASRLVAGAWLLVSPALDDGSATT